MRVDTRPGSLYVPDGIPQPLRRRLEAIMRHRAILYAIGVVLINMVPNGLPSRAMQPCLTEGSLLTPHAPILIVNDGGFTSANGVTSGDGTPANPYVIEGWDISIRFANGIEIRNTLAHFV